MIINYTSIVRSRFDAPFIGTLLTGCYCRGSCRGCFNQHLKSTLVQQDDADKILDEIQQDPFSEGIILGGLEWLDGQSGEAIYLIKGALSRGMQAMLYTRQSEWYLKTHYPELLHLKGLYIKLGPYDETKRTYQYSSYGVPLASSNQYIIQVD